MQKLLEKVGKFSEDTEIKFRTDKRKVMVINKKEKGVNKNKKNGVLRKLKHIFPNTYQRIKSIRSPAKVGLVVTGLITSPVVSWRGVGDNPPPPPPRAAQLSFFAWPRARSAGREAGPSYLFFGKY